MHMQPNAKYKVYYAIADFHPIEGPIFAVLLPNNAPIDINLEFEIASSALYISGFGRFMIDDHIVISYSFSVFGKKNIRKERKLAIIVILKEKCKEIEDLIQNIFQDIVSQHLNPLLHSINWNKETENILNKLVDILKLIKHKIDLLIHSHNRLLPRKKKEKINHTVPRFIIVNKLSDSIITNIDLDKLDKFDFSSCLVYDKWKNFILIVESPEKSSVHSAIDVLKVTLDISDDNLINLNSDDIAYVLSINSSLNPDEKNLYEKISNYLLRFIKKMS